MPRANLYIIVAAVLVYACTSSITLRDRLLVSTLHQIERNAQFEPSAKELFEGAMTGMACVLSEKYGDEYSMYIPSRRQARFQDNLDNRYEGLGFLTRIYEEGDETKQLFIGYPHHNAPAYRAGLRSGDQIVQIDGDSIEGKTNSEVYALLRQNRNTRLSVVPFGQTESKEVIVQRERIHSDSVEGDYFDGDRRAFLLETYPAIGYIRITLFSPMTGREFSDALDSMLQSGVESFILDLRDNSGGDVGSCLQIAQMLIAPDKEENVIVTVRPRNGVDHHRILYPGLQRTNLPMAVLINGESASSSEILAAALQDHRRAVVVGTRSFGKGVMQNIFPLPFRSGMLQLTSAEYRRPSGGAIHRRLTAEDTDEWGVVPDIVVELSEAEKSAIAAYRLLRSNTISENRQAVLEHFREQIIVRETDSESPFGFTGNAPYYDVQLDAAVRIVSAQHSPEL